MINFSTAFYGLLFSKGTKHPNKDFGIEIDHLWPSESTAN